MPVALTSSRALRALLSALALSAAPAFAEEEAPAAKPAAEKPEAEKPAAKAHKAAVESANDQARFLAGLPVGDDSPLKALENTAAWKSYAKSLDADWAKLHEQRFDKMVAWSTDVLARKTDMNLPVFYLFGGPDYLSMSALYPDAPAYILCGLEPLGKVPAISSLSAADLSEGLKNLRLSLNSIVRLSFFKTNDMAGDLTRTELRGILPILYVFVARAGGKVLDETKVEITDTGDIKELGEHDKCVGIPGVRLRIQREGHDKPQELFYFKHNVEDSVIKTGPSFFTFFKKYAPANTFLKAASFLLHRPKQFGLTHDFLLANSKSILQDDSGLPFASTSTSDWNRTLFGTYLKPRPPFTNRLQDDMTAAFKAGPVEPLPFLTGYRHEGESNLVLAVKKDGTK
jgi:hypothetical protein